MDLQLNRVHFRAQSCGKHKTWKLRPNIFTFAPVHCLSGYRMSSQRYDGESCSLLLMEFEVHLSGSQPALLDTHTGPSSQSIVRMQVKHRCDDDPRGRVEHRGCDSTGEFEECVQRTMSMNLRTRLRSSILPTTAQAGGTDIPAKADWSWPCSHAVSCAGWAA